MKKIILLFLIISLLAIVAVYIFIPATLAVSSVVAIQGSAAGTNRTLQQKEKWKQFWQGNRSVTPASALTPVDLFMYNKDTFRITQLLQNALSIAVSGNQLTVQTTLLTLPVLQDSVLLQWSYNVPSSLNPFTRIQQYEQAVQTKKNMDTVLNMMKTFLDKNENIYGVNITQTSTNDTFLISTNKIINAYPSTDDIYGLIEKLQLYAAASNAAQTGNPMMNVTQLTAQQYKIMVAIPVNKLLNESGDITYKRMVPGRFLTATVTGGNGAVNTAYNQLQQYFDDYGRTSMAIPFGYLITDRNKETDTSKWITKLYFPVM